MKQFLQQSERLGIEVRWSHEGMHKLDAVYQAFPGSPGRIVLHDRDPKPSPQQICILLSHEMVHVLQHWKGDLKALTPLGWPRDSALPGRSLSVIELEAYSAQDQPLKVLNAVKNLKSKPSHMSP